MDTNLRKGIDSLHPQLYEKLVIHYTELAKTYNLNYIPLCSMHVNPNMLLPDMRLEYLRLQAIPLDETDEMITVVTANPKPENIQAIENAWGKNKKLKFFVTSLQEITDAIAQRFSEEYTYEISYKLRDMDPLHSSMVTFTWIEKVIPILFLIGLGISFSFDFLKTWVYGILIISTITLILMMYKYYLSSISFKWKLNESKHKELPNILDKDYPYYTVLIPLYHEPKEVISQLVNSLEKIDYPKEKLDVKLLLEMDDEETQESIKQIDLPIYFQIIVVPQGQPKTKPRACNYGLSLAIGKYLTIYDAEDKPGEEQLKKALQAFTKGNYRLVCVQAALNYYNQQDNLITRLFTLEYCHWFDQMIPALAYKELPVPLGGTSNHFKTKILRKIGGWAPAVGTEDAEIGVRLFRKGYRTQCIHSTTYEEASSTVVNWFRQRVRWNKGYMQTYLIHMRDPIKLLKQIGLRSYISFQLYVGGNVFISLANLLLWIFFVLDMFFIAFEPVDAYESQRNLALFNFFVANLIIMFSQFTAAFQRGYKKLLIDVIFIPFYWAFMSLAGYYAWYELIFKPSYWYKTQHGMSPLYKRSKNKK